MQRRTLFGSLGAGARVGAPCSAVTRREAVALGAVVAGNCVLGAAAGFAEGADERPHAGDQLVSIDAAEPVPLSPGDIPGSQILAWPMEPGSKLVRSGSRLNKI